MILPKCWLARIQKYWDAPLIPTDIPESSSTFSTTYDSEETKNAIKEMEDNLNTESSIVQPTDIPENEALSEYLGTFNVEGTPGELTLLSPNKVDSLSVSATAYHYNEENATWDKIPDTQIIDGYVWGTVDSFSPIAVFTTRLDTYVLDKLFNINAPAYIANGVPIVVSVNDEGKTIVTDTYGKVTEITDKTIVVGGSLDHNLDSISVAVLPGSKFNGLKAGSCYDGKNETPLTVNKIKVVIDGVDNNKFGVTGSYGAVRTNEVDITVKNSNIDFTGAGESICNKNDANKADANNCSMASKAWIKKSTVTIDNSYVDCAYGAGNCGYMYSNDATLIFKNGSGAQWAICGGSNGATGTGRIIAEDSTIKYYQSTNRGPVKYAEEKAKNCNVEYFFVAGDSTDSTVTGTVDKVKTDIEGGTINFYPGTLNGVKITRVDAAKIVDSIKITKDTNVTYMDDADIIFEGMIKSK